MDFFEVKNNYTLADVPLLVRRLRDPEEGCAWDKLQTHDSIRQNFLEEACEAMDAIDRKDTYALCEELGDVLLQISLHSEMEREQGTFDIDAVADMLCKKLVLRHPHIFGDVQTDDPEQVLKNWEDIKRVEKSQKTGSDAIEAVPKALPALMRSQKVQKRAAYVGFDYENVQQAMGDLRSEVEELSSAVAGEGDVFEELGDVLFSAVNVARFTHVDSELALTRACDKFAARFKETERLAAERGIDMPSASLDSLNGLWAQAKLNLSNIKETTEND
ncbi:MAG: nucleoside triphosphate pyrophosphohydrolase [Oscillospiraceae bacterium]|nr:nucleoside triphosphate pyrophosphohydrolase [Oscillospiraceae bacterium]MBQ9959109.1 nucleoside triphosphate pyrophosphohydrolase [Oscillospiraceae bacterium]